MSFDSRKKMPDDPGSRAPDFPEGIENERTLPSPELAIAHFQNLVATTEIAGLFLDSDLRIKRFTPIAQQIFKLSASDIGRPISEITDRLAGERLIAGPAQVLQELTPSEGGAGVLETIVATNEALLLGALRQHELTAASEELYEKLRALSRQMETQLHQFNSVMSAVPDLVYQFDREGRFTYISQSLLDLWQKTQEEAIGKNFHELDYPPDLAAKLQRQIQEVIETGLQLKDETPYTSAKGERMYEYIFFPLLGEESVEGVAGITRDITERKTIEQALRESEARFRAMFEQASVGIVQIGEEGHFLAANRGFCEFIGYGEAELQQMQVREVTDPADHAEEEELTRRLASGEIPEFTLDKRYLRKDGATIWGTMTATFVRRGSGEPLYTLAIVQAIGDRKRAEEELRASEERFRQFAENSVDVFWIVEAEKQVLEYLNPVFDEMFGEPRATLLRNIERYYELVHPDDRALAGTAMRSALAGKRAVVEYRIIRPSDGAVRWIRDTGFPMPDENGRIARVAGVAQDVTEDKNRMEEIRRAEERFRLLVEGTPDYAMFLIDPENKISYWSGGAEKVFGWRAEEAVGQTGELIFTPEDRAMGAVEKEIGIALDQGHAPDRRWHLRKNGSRLWVDGIMRRLDRADGSLRGFAKIARDATDQWRAQEELRSAHDELEHRVHDRTKELQAMNETLEAEMQRRQRLESEILQVTERERANISQDLHDSLCQELTATAFLLKSRARALARTDPEAGEALIEGAEMVNRNAGLARDLARGLHPLELGSGGLISALRELASRTSQTVTCRCECPRSLRVPDEAVAVNLYRIAQEAVTNALKHAKPTDVVIVIERRQDEIHLVITDNGTPKRARKTKGGLGIQMMQYRANVSGGTLKVESKKGKGTRVSCRVPAKQ